MAKIALSKGEIDYLLLDGTMELPPLVLLHEGLGCVAMWRRFPYRLAEMTGRRVLVYSRYGYGHSSAVTLPRRVDYMHVEALHVLPELLARLGIHEPVLVGHSDGASIALLHASEFPVTGLVLLAPHVFVETITLDGIQTARQAFLNGELERQLALFHHHPRTVFEGWSSVWLSPLFRDWNIAECLVNIHCPTLLLQGDHDEYGTLAQLDTIRLSMCGAAVQHCLDDCGHSPHLQQPERTLRLLVDFITQLANVAASDPELQ